MRKRIPDGFGGDAAEDRLGTALVFCGFTFVFHSASCGNLALQYGIVTDIGMRNR